MQSAHKRTKILATLGPAAGTVRQIEALMRAGADCFRVNMSHGDRAQHIALLEAIAAAGQRCGQRPGILADLQGPKIRTGQTEGDRPVTLTRGAVVRLTARSALCTAGTISVSYPRLARDVAPGQHVLINDGAVRLRVAEVDRRSSAVVCRVMNTGDYSSRKGVNFPETALQVPSLTRKDREDTEFLLGHEVAFIALSFVRRAADMKKLARLVRARRSDIRLIAKIEKPEAIEELGTILEAADGIMVARGDLGVEVSPYRIAVLQKQCISEANARGKLVIVATQMLESMIRQPLPTRAEATDVANAIIDGTDAVMLSGETSVGDYPVAAVETMAQIARTTEASQYCDREPLDLNLRTAYPPHAVCEAAARAARDLGDVPVVVFTESGDTALYLSKIRPRSPLFAFTPHERVARMLALAWNIIADVLPVVDNVADLQIAAERELRRCRRVAAGDLIVFLCGTTTARGATNMLRVARVGRD